MRVVRVVVQTPVAASNAAGACGAKARALVLVGPERALAPHRAGVVAHDNLKVRPAAGSVTNCAVVIGSERPEENSTKVRTVGLVVAMNQAMRVVVERVVVVGNRHLRNTREHKRGSESREINTPGASDGPKSVA